VGGEADSLAAHAGEVRAWFDGSHAARETGLAACRRVIRACGSSIRAVHRGDREGAATLADEAEAHLREAQGALAAHPALAFAGFLHDAEKEYAEARLTAALVGGTPLPGPGALHVQVPAFVNGLAEAASELRRNILDRLRAGEHDRAEALLAAMDDVYGVLVTFDYPDAVTGGLRRTVDALRAVLERTRSDLTLTSVQQRLAGLIERELGARE
jgi:translin